MYLSHIVRHIFAAGFALLKKLLNNVQIFASSAHLRPDCQACHCLYCGCRWVLAFQNENHDNSRETRHWQLSRFFLFLKYRIARHPIFPILLRKQKCEVIRKSPGTMLSGKIGREEIEPWGHFFG